MQTQNQNGTSTADINYLFNNCKQMLTTDRSLAKTIAQRPDFLADLTQYMIGSRFTDDDLILFNWFIGTTFNTCVTELKKLH